MPRHECPGGHFAGGTTMPTTPVHFSRAGVRFNLPMIYLGGGGGGGTIAYLMHSIYTYITQRVIILQI